MAAVWLLFCRAFYFGHSFLFCRRPLTFARLYFRRRIKDIPPFNYFYRHLILFLFFCFAGKNIETPRPHFFLHFCRLKNERKNGRLLFGAVTRKKKQKYTAPNRGQNKQTHKWKKRWPRIFMAGSLSLTGRFAFSTFIFIMAQGIL